MTPSSPVRWGVMSTARHAAQTWIPACAASGGVLAAVASRDAVKAADFARQHGFARSYGTYEALLDDPDVDAVYIPLPNHLHYEWTLRAAAAGKHVMCEKPLGLDAVQAAEMAAAFEGTGLILGEAFQWRHYPRDKQVRQMIRSGEIGELRFIDAGFWFTLDRPGDVRWEASMGGGALYDVGCYPISLARFMAGSEPVAVTAQGVWGSTNVDTAVIGTLFFANGVMATINCGFTLPLRRYYEVSGTGGMLGVYLAYNPRADQPGRIVRYGDDRTVIDTLDTGRHDSYELMIGDFNRAVRGEGEYGFPPQDAVNNMRVIDALYRAARDGGTVRLD